LRRETDRENSLRKLDITRERNTVYGVGFFEKMRVSNKKSKKER